MNSLSELASQPNGWQGEITQKEYKICSLLSATTTKNTMKQDSAESKSQNITANNRAQKQKRTRTRERTLKKDSFFAKEKEKERINSPLQADEE